MAVVKAKQETQMCTCCGKEKSIKTGYYVSNSVIYQNKSKLPICKECVWRLYDEFVGETDCDEQVALYRICRLLDFPYLQTPFDSAVDEAEKNGGNTLKVYLKNINSLKQYQEYTFENGDSIDKEKREIKEIAIIEEQLTTRDKQNEEDVIRILGYDPFDTENKKDRKYLFNRLVDMLDDSTVEDNLLLMSVIEIVKGFNQIDKINKMISTITSDMDKLSSNNGGMKSLIDTKKNLMSTILKIAEDNGISTKFNTTKSKGSGTLSGIIKTLDELGLEEARVNLFDIQTSKAMSEIDYKSHDNIIKQLQLDESDYAQMVAQQKDMIFKLDKKSMRLEEELRKLKIKCKENNVDYSDLQNVYVDAEFEEVFTTEYDSIKEKEQLAIEEEKRNKEANEKKEIDE